jgi:hypothetical protein
VKKPLKKTTTMKNTLSIFIAIIIFTSCKKDNNNTPAAATTPVVFTDSNLGTFIGDLMVVTDQPGMHGTGYIYNAKVTVISNGIVATLKIVGDDFDREYKAKSRYADMINSNPSLYASLNSPIGNMERQVKPVDKIVSGDWVISGNELAFEVNISSDTVTVKDTKKGGSFVVLGKTNFIGTVFIKQ